MKVKKATIDDFLAQSHIAVVGASNKKGKFGNMAFKALWKNGFNLTPINPNETYVDGKMCYPTISECPEKVDAVLMLVQPQYSTKVTEEALKNGITHFWFQQGSDHHEAIALCERYAVEPVSNKCILMFADKNHFPHNLHGVIDKLLGKYPVN